MSSETKRVNLTLPLDLYERLQAYKKQHGIIKDAAACTLLISQKLDEVKLDEAMVTLAKSLPQDQLLALVMKGIEATTNEKK